MMIEKFQMSRNTQGLYFITIKAINNGMASELSMSLKNNEDMPENEFYVFETLITKIEDFFNTFNHKNFTFKRLIYKEEDNG